MSVFTGMIEIQSENYSAFGIDPFIKNRIYQLAEPEYFLGLIEYLEMESLDLLMLQKGYKIFGDYREFIER